MPGASDPYGLLFQQLTAVVNWVEADGHDSLQQQKVKTAANCLIQKSQLGGGYQNSLRTQNQLLGLPRFNKVLQTQLGSSLRYKHTNKSNSDLETQLAIEILKQAMEFLPDRACENLNALSEAEELGSHTILAKDLKASARDKSSSIFELFGQDFADSSSGDAAASHMSEDALQSGIDMVRADASDQFGNIARNFTEVMTWVESQGNASREFQSIMDAANCLNQKGLPGYQIHLRSQCQIWGINRRTKIVQGAKSTYPNKLNSDLAQTLREKILKQAEKLRSDCCPQASRMVHEAEELVSHTHLAALVQNLESRADSTVLSQPTKKGRPRYKATSICQHIGQVSAISSSSDAAAADMSEAAPQSEPVMFRRMLQRRHSYNLTRQMGIFERERRKRARKRSS